MAQDSRKLANCDECGRLITADRGLELCLECFGRQLQAYKRIEKVLAETPDISVSELSRRANVSKSVIGRLARKGRIKLRSSDEPIHCARCGASMKEVGKFCAVCRAELMLEAKDAAATLKAKARERLDSAARAQGIVSALTRKRSIFRHVDYGTKGKYSP
jgi:predicted amidophosphoribosyltransferase